MTHVKRLNINGNPNIGLYGYCNDEYCLLGKEVDKNIAEEIEKVLKVPVHRITISGTSLIGVLVNGNSTKLLLPEITRDDELKALDKLGINYEVIKTNLTAFGNNILCNDKGALVNPDFSAVVKKQIRQALNVTLHPGTVADVEVVGSCVVFNSGNAVIHAGATDEDISEVEGLLGVECTKTTANFGSPYLKSAILANSNGFIVGDASTGVEMANIDEGLGFL